jgi:hypothetical protein
MAFKSPSTVAKMSLGDRFEAMTAFAFRGCVVKQPTHDVVAAGKHLECKSRTRGSDGGSYLRIALYTRYFEGSTHGIVFGYFDERGLVERAYLVPIKALKPHFDVSAKVYRGSLRWRPTRLFIEAMPERRDITDHIRRIEDLLPC